MSDPWPPPPGTSPFAAEQMVAARLATLRVTPWVVRVSRTLRSVEVELSSPGEPGLCETIKGALEPLSAQVVWYEGSFEEDPRQ